MATVNDVTNQIDQDGQYPKDDKFKLNALNELYEQYKQFKGNKTFIEWLNHYAKVFDQGPYNGYSKEELVTAARTYANDYPVINGITNGTKTLTQEGRAGDSTSINERSNRDLPSEENGITTGETAENTQQLTTNTTEPTAIGDNPELQEEKTKTPSTDKKDIEESEADQEPGGSGTMGVVSGRDLLNAGREEFRRLSDITSNMNNNNNNQESALVREEKENVPPSSTTTTTANKSDTPTPTSTPVEEEKTPTPASARTSTPVGQPAEIVDYSEPEMPSIRPVDRGRFDYIRNNGWGSNSSILTRMGYSQDEIRRILDSSGAVRPEYFSY